MFSWYFTSLYQTMQNYSSIVFRVKSVVKLLGKNILGTRLKEGLERNFDFRPSKFIVVAPTEKQGAKILDRKFSWYFAGLD